MREALSQPSTGSARPRSRVERRKAQTRQKLRSPPRGRCWPTTPPRRPASEITETADVGFGSCAACPPITFCAITAVPTPAASARVERTRRQSQAGRPRRPFSDLPGRHRRATTIQVSSRPELVVVGSERTSDNRAPSRKRPVVLPFLPLTLVGEALPKTPRGRRRCRYGGRRPSSRLPEPYVPASRGCASSLGTVAELKETMSPEFPAPRSEFLPAGIPSGRRPGRREANEAALFVP